jgi:predicted transcriptional regulator
MAQRASQKGAEVVAAKAGSQCARMLLQYLAQGPLTDLEMHKAIGLPESRISARRSGLMDRGLVRWYEDVRGPFGAPNGKYGLTGLGEAIARKLAQ